MAGAADTPHGEWISANPTFIHSARPLSDELPAAVKRAVPQGARLQARQTGTADEFLQIADGTLDGEPVASDLIFIRSDDWVTVTAPVSAALTAERLMGARWRFGMIGQAALTTSFFFGRDGRISGYRNANESYWNCENGTLLILNAAGQLAWSFTLHAADEGLLTLRGFSHRAPQAESAELTEMRAVEKPAPLQAAPQAETAADGAKGDDRIKMIIWDLDETFWSGTLAEGGISPIPAHIDFIKTITMRGIVNSICSKNEFIRTKQELIALGAWDYFIFPKIDFAPKGAMIRDIIEAAQLRAASVLFIDDNIININEALHYNPGLQVCGPEMISSLLDDSRCKGNADPQMTRLDRYKVLEQKSADRGAANADNLDFLRNSDIRISFHHELGNEFPRLHDLVNRTNQLNFTKKRWPEDEAQALEAFTQEQKQSFHSHWGYIKVSDKYGSYGICGFYFVSNNEAQHFLFSCRTLNMGIEQFVWQKIGRPPVKTIGEVVSSLGDSPDWIRVVGDVDAAAEGNGLAQKMTICVRGACDLAMMNHYLRMRYETQEEFAFPYQEWEIHSCARVIAVYDEVNTPAGKALISRMPGMPPRRFESEIHTGASDVYVLSFSSEVFCGLYRSHSTGIVLPLNYSPFSRQEFRNFSWAELVAKTPRVPFSEAQWNFMQEEFKLLGVLELEQLSKDIKVIFEKLRGKIVIVLMLNTEVGNNRWILGEFSKINAVVQPLVEAYGYHRVDMTDFVRSNDDLATPEDGGVHFKREIYQKFAERVAGLIESHPAPAVLEALPAS